MKVAGEIAGMYYGYRHFQKDTFTTEGIYNQDSIYPRAISVSNTPATSLNKLT